MISELLLETLFQQNTAVSSDAVQDITENGRISQHIPRDDNVAVVVNCFDCCILACQFYVFIFGTLAEKTSVRCVDRHFSLKTMELKFTLRQTKR